MRKWKLLALLPIYALAFAFQQEEIPEYPGDPETGAHKGQPMFCTNEDRKMFRHNCECQAMHQDDDRCANDNEDATGPDTSRCKVYCRKEACECHSKCET